MIKKSWRHSEEYLRLLWCRTACSVGPYTTKSGFATRRSAKTTDKMNNGTAICERY